MLWDTDGDGKVEEQSVDKKLIRRINQIGMATFFRWSATIPRVIENWNVFHAESTCQQLARVYETEIENKGENIGETDRLLAVHLCPAEDGEGGLALRFSGSDEVTGDVDLHFNVETSYEELEGAWVWFYFGYSEKLKKKILAVHFLRSDRWVVHEFDNVVKRKFIHLKSLDFVVGGSHGWDGLNAVFAQPKFEVIKDSYKPTEEDIKKYFEDNFKVPSFGTLKKAGEYNFEDQEEMKAADTKASIISFAKKFEGAEEYSVNGWWLFDEPVENNEDEHTFFTFTQNNPTTGKFKNGDAFGDLTLTFSITRDELKFCTYTMGKNGNDNGSKKQCISHFMGVSRAALWWAYTYVGYSRAQQKFFVYLKFEGKTFKFEQRALHFAPNWTGMYYLRDTINKGGFEGSTKRMQLKAGPGSFTDNTDDLDALAGVSPEPTDVEVPADQLPNGNTYELTIGAKKPAYRLDLPKGTARLSTEFRIEFWSKISLSNPERVVDTSKFFTKGCRHLARAYEGVYTADKENMKNDRLMAVFFCAGGEYQYRFFTYYENVRDDQDLNGYSINMEFDEMEGVWNYIYFGYDSKIKVAYAGVYSNSQDTLRTLKIPASRPRGKVTRVGYLIGAGFGLGTINGIVTSAKVQWDDDSYLSSDREILENIDGENTVP